MPEVSSQRLTTSPGCSQRTARRSDPSDPVAALPEACAGDRDDCGVATWAGAEGATSSTAGQLWQGHGNCTEVAQIHHPSCKTMQDGHEALRNDRVQSLAAPSTPSALTPVVEMRDLTMQWGPRPVLDRVNLRMEPGERLAVVGAFRCWQVDGAAPVGRSADAHLRCTVAVWRAPAVPAP